MVVKRSVFMKPFLCVDLTNDKKNTTVNGDEFLTATPSLASSQSLEDSKSDANEKLEKSKLPKPLRILQTVCGFVGFVALLGVLRSTVTFSEAYQNAPYIFWLIAVCLPAWLALVLLGIYRKKTVLSTEESTHALENLESRMESIFSELGAPESSRDADVLVFFYKTKGDKVKICSKGAQVAPYINPIYKVFADSENLYLVDLEGKYSIPLSCIKGIRTVKKHVRIKGWNKEAVFNKGIYQQYKMNTDQYGTIHCGYYHIMDFERDGEAWEMYIPCYELPLFERLTGVKAQ